MTIKVVMTCYSPTDGHDREKYARASLWSLINNLTAPEPLRYVLANDGSIQQPFITKLITELGEDHIPCGASGGPRAGIGGSLNRALKSQVDGDDLWLYTTDDWKLADYYDLTQAVRLIRELGYDYVRLGPPHPNIDCRTRFQAGLGWWLDLYSTNGGFVFATRPFLATRHFYGMVGQFKEGCDAYVCERDYSDRVQEHDVHVAEVVSGSLEGPWEHIGEVEVGSTFP